MAARKKPAAVFWFDLGNVVERPGHRTDCAQVKVRISVVAADVAEARQLLVDGRGLVFSYEAGPRAAHAKPIEVQRD